MITAYTAQYEATYARSGVKAWRNSQEQNTHQVHWLCNSMGCSNDHENIHCTVNVVNVFIRLPSMLTALQKIKSWQPFLVADINMSQIYMAQIFMARACEDAQHW